MKNLAGVKNSDESIKTKTEIRLIEITKNKSYEKN